MMRLSAKKAAHPIRPLTTRPTFFLRLLVVASVSLFAPSSFAAPVVYKTKAFAGQSEMNDGQAHMEWRAWFDVTANQVIKRLTTWKHSKVFQERAVGFELIESKDDSAAFVVEQKTPLFFMPNIKILFDATVRRENGKTVVTWIQREGPAISAIRKWTVTSRAQGAWVQHETRVVLPFSPPAFLQGDQWQAVSNQVAVARREFGATTTRREPPPVDAAPSSVPPTSSTSSSPARVLIPEP